MFDRIYLWSYQILGTCLFEIFKSVSISVLVVGLFTFLFVPGSVLGDCNFPRIWLFLPGCPFYWHTVIYIDIQWSHTILCVSVVSVIAFPFLILLIWVLFFFFLMSLAKGLSILFIFSKNQVLVSLIFAIVLFVSISSISALIFMISFLLLILVFVCSFSSC